MWVRRVNRVRGVDIYLGIYSNIRRVNIKVFIMEYIDIYRFIYVELERCI